MREFYRSGLWCGEGTQPANICSLLITSVRLGLCPVLAVLWREACGARCEACGAQCEADPDRLCASG